MQNPKASHQDSAEMAITIIMIINNNKKMNPHGKGFHSQSVSCNKRRQSCRSGWAISKLDTFSVPTHCHFFKLRFLKKRCTWILQAKERELTVWSESTNMNHGAPHKRYQSRLGVFQLVRGIFDNVQRPLGSQLEWGAIGIWWVEARDFNMIQSTGQLPQQRLISPDVSSPEAEKPWSSLGWNK